MWCRLIGNGLVSPPSMRARHTPAGRPSHSTATAAVARAIQNSRSARAATVCVPGSPSAYQTRRNRSASTSASTRFIVRKRTTFDGTQAPSPGIITRRPTSCGRLQFSSKNNHIHQTNPAFDNRMIVMIREEMLDPMGANETALLIERYRQRAVARADLQYGISPLIRSRHKIEQGPPVSEPVTFRNDGDVFDLQNAIALIRYHAFGFHAIIVKHIHDATLKISAHHALLFIGEQQQWKETLPITGYLSDFHSGSPSHGHIRSTIHHTVRQSQPGHDSVGGLCVQWAGHHGRPKSEGSVIKTFRRLGDGACRQPPAH